MINWSKQQLLCQLNAVMTEWGKISSLLQKTATKNTMSNWKIKQKWLLSLIIRLKNNKKNTFYKRYFIPAVKTSWIWPLIRLLVYVGVWMCVLMCFYLCTIMLFVVSEVGLYQPVFSAVFRVSGVNNPFKAKIKEGLAACKKVNSRLFIYLFISHFSWQWMSSQRVLRMLHQAHLWAKSIAHAHTCRKCLNGYKEVLTWSRVEFCFWCGTSPFILFFNSFALSTFNPHLTELHCAEDYCGQRKGKRVCVQGRVWWCISEGVSENEKEMMEIEGRSSSQHHSYTHTHTHTHTQTNKQCPHPYSSNVNKENWKWVILSECEIDCFSYTYVPEYDKLIPGERRAANPRDNFYCIFFFFWIMIMIIYLFRFFAKHGSPL